MEIKPYSEARLTNAQDGVLRRYKERYSLTDKEAMALHMFYSPYRVQRGLTKDEVHLIIQVYPLLSSYRRSVFSAMERFLKEKPTASTRVLETPLPDELVQVGRVTRGDFRKGIRVLLETLEILS